MVFKAYDDQIRKINEFLKDTDNPNEIMELMNEKKQLIQECINDIK